MTTTENKLSFSDSQQQTVVDQGEINSLSYRDEHESKIFLQLYADPSEALWSIEYSEGLTVCSLLFFEL